MNEIDSPLFSKITMVDGYKTMDKSFGRYLWTFKKIA